jgi:OmpA-OmpF porin, OOP family
VSPNRLAALTVLIATSALAQVEPLPHFQLERLQLDPSGVGPMTVGTGTTVDEGAFRAFAVVHYQRLPLIAVRGDDAGAVVRDRITTHLGLSYGVFDRLEAYAQLPIVVFQEGENVRAVGIASPASSGMSTPLVGARYQLWEHDAAVPLDVAFGVTLVLPLGSNDALANERSLALVPSVSAGMDVAETARLSGELSASLRRAVPLRTRTSARTSASRWARPPSATACAESSSCEP